MEGLPKRPGEALAELLLKAPGEWLEAHRISGIWMLVPIFSVALFFLWPSKKLKKTNPRAYQANQGISLVLWPCFVLMIIAAIIAQYRLLEK